ncbi:cell wall anchor protein [uncultured Tenacibaculum sp.]|uniref:cell wall anchor protein n=1 Tax=uncultured Tenacibaculum sp. TaxID=174713 RepID=UPI0026036185|nr:cell wall anchor protein [uncultured Tenacibaculum sp.]
MKKLFIIIPSLLLSFSIFSQTSDRVKVLDTRNTNEIPYYYNNEVKFEFKKRDIINSPGLGAYSGLFTFAPWSDNSGGLKHQLNFNTGGIFYRRGSIGTGWNNWYELLTKDADGSISNKAPIRITTNSDSPLSFINTDNSSQYIQFIQSGSRKVYVGLDTHNNFVITKENGGNIALRGAKVGIGTVSIPTDYMLAIAGKTITEEVKVQIRANWPDFVFNKDYQLPTLKEVEKHIKEKGHLKNIPSAKEVKDNDGIELGEMNRKLLQKIEELTLYTIQQQKELQQQKEKNSTLEARLLKLEKLISK